MNENDGGWDHNFPQVMHFIDLINACAKPWKLLEAHPYYEAAKNREDKGAAMRLVQDFLKTPENQSQLQRLRCSFPDAILVSIHAIEAEGKNRIPQMLADYIGRRTGLQVDDSVVQSNRVLRTGTDEWHRFAFRPSYIGSILPNRKFILVDDVFSLGGSFNELRRFIESKDSKVVHTIALATGRSGPEIALNPKTLNNLLDRYGKNKLQSFLKEIDLYGGNYNALTEPEARALRRAPSLDEARDRIFAARQKGVPSMGTERTQENGRETPQIDTFELYHPRKLRR
jgi:hypothetical protein